MSSMDYNNNGEIHLDFDEPVEKLGGKKIIFILHGKEYILGASEFRKVLYKGLSVMGREMDYARIVKDDKV